MDEGGLSGVKELLIVVNEVRLFRKSRIPVLITSLKYSYWDSLLDRIEHSVLRIWELEWMLLCVGNIFPPFFFDFNSRASRASCASVFVLRFRFRFGF